jgi:hypothetical protein
MLVCYTPSIPLKTKDTLMMKVFLIAVILMEFCSFSVQARWTTREDAGVIHLKYNVHLDIKSFKNVEKTYDLEHKIMRDEARVFGSSYVIEYDYSSP